MMGACGGQGGPGGWHRFPGTFLPVHKQRQTQCLITQRPHPAGLPRPISPDSLEIISELQSAADRCGCCLEMPSELPRTPLRPGTCAWL
nr:uncharacterized protein LOC129459823 isoform X1 [Symphalangus syndactylus]